MKSTSCKRAVMASALWLTLAAAAQLNPSYAATPSENKVKPVRKVNSTKVDFSGIWVLDDDTLISKEGSTSTGASEEPGETKPPFGSMPEFKGVYLESFQKRSQALKGSGGEFLGTCQPQGMPGIMIGPYAIEIMQTSKQINWTQEFLQETRRIYIDGRKHPDPSKNPPTFAGYSVGRWEGSTLVVDTINIRPETVLGEYGRTADGLGHSERLHIHERFFINKEGVLQVDATLTDPDALVKPWKYSLTYRRAPKGVEFVEYICEDHNAETFDPVNGTETTTIPARKNLKD